MIRVKLLKRWKHPYKDSSEVVGTILQCAPYLAGELIADGIGEVYNGEYPPKTKRKISLRNLKK